MRPNCCLIETNYKNVHLSFHLPTFAPCDVIIVLWMSVMWGYQCVITQCSLKIKLKLIKRIHSRFGGESIIDPLFMYHKHWCQNLPAAVGLPVSHKLNQKCCQNENQPLSVCPGQKEEASASTPIPVNDLKFILSLAREQYLKIIDSSLPSAATCLTYKQETARNSGRKTTKKNPSIFTSIQSYTRNLSVGCT